MKKIRVMMGLNLEEKVDGHEIVEDEKHGGFLDGVFALAESLP